MSRTNIALASGHELLTVTLRVPTLLSLTSVIHSTFKLGNVAKGIYEVEVSFKDHDEGRASEEGTPGKQE